MQKYIKDERKEQTFKNRCRVLSTAKMLFIVFKIPECAIIQCFNKNSVGLFGLFGRCVRFVFQLEK